MGTRGKRTKELHQVGAEIRAIRVMVSKGLMLMRAAEERPHSPYYET